MPQPVYSPLRGKRSEITLPAFLAKTLPYHQIRVEPMFYSWSMLLAIKNPPAAEIINDMGGLLGDFWRTMRDDADFQRFSHVQFYTLLRIRIQGGEIKPG